MRLSYDLGWSGLPRPPASPRLLSAPGCTLIISAGCLFGASLNALITDVPFELVWASGIGALVATLDVASFDFGASGLYYVPAGLQLLHILLGVAVWLDCSWRVYRKFGATRRGARLKRMYRAHTL